LPANNLQELIAAAKTQPGKLSFASAGVGGTLHVAGVLLEREAGINLNHIPYRGGALAMTDLAAGTVDLALADITLVKPLLASGRIRVLAIASGERSALLSDVPTTTEAGFPNVRLDTWYALFAPAGMPAEITAKLRAAVEKLKNNTNFLTTLTGQGLAPVKGTSAVFEEQLKKDWMTWPPLLARICGQNACD
jgi:tripartite-type tricarboxylate transporter receptor subunit TctC